MAVCLIMKAKSSRGVEQRSGIHTGQAKRVRGEEKRREEKRREEKRREEKRSEVEINEERRSKNK